MDKKYQTLDDKIMEEPRNTLEIVKGSFYKNRVTRFSQFILAKVKKILRKSQLQFREKLVTLSFNAYAQKIRTQKTFC